MMETVIRSARPPVCIKHSPSNTTLDVHQVESWLMGTEYSVNKVFQDNFLRHSCYLVLPFSSGSRRKSFVVLALLTRANRKGRCTIRISWHKCFLANLTFVDESNWLVQWLIALIINDWWNKRVWLKATAQDCQAEYVDQSHASAISMFWCRCIRFIITRFSSYGWREWNRHECQSFSKVLVAEEHMLQSRSACTLTVCGLVGDVFLTNWKNRP